LILEFRKVSRVLEDVWKFGSRRSASL